MSQITIYSLTCPIEDRVMYVGKAIDKEKRFAQHIYESKTGKSRKSQWINGLVTQGLFPVMEVLEVCSISVWRERENFWISRYELLEPDLKNTTGTANLPYKEPVLSVAHPPSERFKVLLKLPDMGQFTDAFISDATGLHRHTIRVLRAGKKEPTLDRLLDFFASEGMPVTVSDLFTVTTTGD